MVTVITWNRHFDRETFQQGYGWHFKLHLHWNISISSSINFHNENNKEYFFYGNCIYVTTCCNNFRKTEFPNVFYFILVQDFHCNFVFPNTHFDLKNRKYFKRNSIILNERTFTFHTSHMLFALHKIFEIDLLIGYWNFTLWHSVFEIDTGKCHLMKIFQNLEFFLQILLQLRTK